MCSICGILAPSLQSREKLTSDTHIMANSMQHRGPDAQGTYIETHVALAHNRLAIIDLQTGNQPIFNHDKSKVIIFNGEIYNHLTLKEELVSLGYTFQTATDTEVILYGYEEWGKGILSKLEGGFAFAIWDIVSQSLFLCRDHIGEKPLFYMLCGDTLYFASELKALVAMLTNRPEINQDALSSYFTYKYIPAPLTIYKDIYKLQSGCYMVSTLNSPPKIFTYWDAKEDWKPQYKIDSYHDAKEMVRIEVVDAIKKQMNVDVPLGTFLSGGIDSSIVTAVAAQISSRPLDTFSIGFSNKEFDECAKAKQIASLYKTNHHQVILDYKNVVSEIDRILLNYDEPFADSSAIPSYYVAKIASDKVKVVLTGDGADETFGGYSSYENAIKLQKFMQIPKIIRSSLVGTCANVGSSIISSNRMRGKLLRVEALASIDKQDLWPSIRRTFSQEELKRLLVNNQETNYAVAKQRELVNELTDADFLDQIMYCDQKTSLPDAMIVKVDRAAMLCSLETRSPFLDQRIIKLAAKIPAKYKINGSNKKAILKDAFEDLLPPNIIKQKKQGFGVPIGNWLYKDLRDQLLELTEPNLIKEQGIFHVDEVQRIVKQHLSQNDYYINDSWRAWSIFVFQKWYFNTYLKIGIGG